MEGAKQFADALLGVAKEHGAPGVAIVLIYLLARHGHRAAPVLEFLRGLARKWSSEDNAPDRAHTLEQAILMVEGRIDAIIDTALQSLVYRYDACRAFIFEYHGYDSRIKPLPWLYCSCTYEYCHPARPVSCEIDNLQRLPMAAIQFWTRELGMHKTICLHDVDDIKSTDLESWKILQAQQISSVYCTSLDGFDGDPVGFLGLDYCGGRETRVRGDADMQNLTLEAIRIAGLLALKTNGTREQLVGKL